MKKACLILFFVGASACCCLAQPYPKQTYKEYIKEQSLNRHVAKKLDSLLKSNAYEDMLSYTDSLTILGYDIKQHYYRTIAYSKLGNMPLAIQEAKKQIKSYPAIPITGFSNATGISPEILEACKKEVEQSDIPPSKNALLDTTLCNELADLFKKDQYKRPPDSLQLLYFQEGSFRLKQIVQERGSWLTRYLTPESNRLTTMLLHYSIADGHHFLSYIIPDCQQGYTSWQSAAIIISSLQVRIGKGIDVPEKYPRKIGRSYSGMYGIVLDKDERIDFDQSFIGIHLASGNMRRHNTTYLQATTSFTSEHYMEELERLRQYYISLGIPPQLIKIVSEKIEHTAESDNDPVAYVITRVEGENTQWTDPIYFD